MSDSDLDGIVRRKPRAVASRPVQSPTTDITASKPKQAVDASSRQPKPASTLDVIDAKKSRAPKSPIWDDTDRQTQLSAGQVPRVFSEAVHRFAAEKNTSLRVLILKGLKMQGLDVPDLALVDKRRIR